MEKQKIKTKLSEVIKIESILCDEPMKKHTSFKVGGPADFLVLPENCEEFKQILECCRQNAIPFYIMGNGTNLLVRDKGYRGVIIKVRHFDQVEIKGTAVISEPGALLKDVAQKALENNLSGMEFASGIPGSLGGAAVMNAGAYNGEMKEIIESVDVITDEGEMKNIPIDTCRMGYRTSLMQEKMWYITKVNLRLKNGDYKTIKEKMDDLNGRRSEKQPLEYPSAGSTFRRPQGYFAGKLVQDCGFKGYVLGGAQVSEKHSGFVINKDNATAADIINLIETIQKKIKTDFGVEMRTEVIMIGE